MTPDGVAPAMALSGPVLDVVLVDLDTQARAAGDGDEAIRVREYRRIGEVVQQVVVDVVMNTEALFLDEGVVGAGVDLQAGGEGDGAERAVQRHRDVVRLCHGGDLAGLADPAGVRWARLDDVDGSTSSTSPAATALCSRLWHSTAIPGSGTASLTAAARSSAAWPRAQVSTI